MDTKYLFCPQCGVRGKIVSNGGAFLEEGEYDPARGEYENERAVSALTCTAPRVAGTTCNYTFYV